MSRILLDTHLLLWAVSEPRKLPKEARRWIDEAEVFLSAASIWEVSIRAAVGKLAYHATRRTPGTESKWMSRETTGSPRCRATAAIQVSLIVIGVPACFSSSRTAP